jgi:hypothetical protein
MIKIISGGQTGVDIAALKAARTVGLPTGGFCPQGWRTANGPNPELASYGLCEMDTPAYRQRTRANVKLSDGTLQLASNWKSLGMRCTATAIHDFKKPALDIDITPQMIKVIAKIDFAKAQRTFHIVDWISDNKIETLNVAGNSEDTAPGIEAFAFQALLAVFALLKEN